MATSRYKRLSVDESFNHPNRCCANEEHGTTCNGLGIEEIDLEDGQVRIETQNDLQNKSGKAVNIAIGSLALILLYLTLSICLTFYQKWVLKELKYPLAIVLYHLIIKLMLSFLVRWIYKLVTGKTRVLLDFRTSLRNMAPTGFASGIDIGFSNWGLELVQISLYTMTKSSTIIFILFFAIILGLERKSWSLVMIVVMISGGLFMFTYKSTQFDVVGFAFLLFASFTSGIRWSFAQLIMQKSKIGLHNPIDMIFHMQPWMIVALIPFTMGFEGKRILEVLNQLPSTSYDSIVFFLTKISFGAVVAFFMEISEFLVLSHTSSLTLSIAGIFKEICQLVLAVEINGDQLTTMNILGLIMCLGGICVHIIHKYSIITKLDETDELLEQEYNNNLKGGSKIESSIAASASNFVTFHKKNGQRIPLLDQQLLESDSDDDSNNDEQNSSEIIFDVLKRRDSSR